MSAGMSGQLLFSSSTKFGCRRSKRLSLLNVSECLCHPVYERANFAFRKHKDVVSHYKNVINEKESKIQELEESLMVERNRRHETIQVRGTTPAAPKTSGCESVGSIRECSRRLCDSSFSCAGCGGHEWRQLGAERRGRHLSRRAPRTGHPPPEGGAHRAARAHARLRPRQVKYVQRQFVTLIECPVTLGNLGSMFLFSVPVQTQFKEMKKSVVTSCSAEGPGDAAGVDAAEGVGGAARAARDSDDARAPGRAQLDGRESGSSRADMFQHDERQSAWPCLRLKI